MSLNGMLYDFIDNLNKAVKIGKNEYSANFESEEFTATDKETGEVIKTKITVFEDDFYDADDIVGYTYILCLKNIDVEEIDAYEFDDDKVKVVIENYAEKIRWFIENQKKYAGGWLDNLCLLTGRLDKKIFTGEARS